MTTISKTGGASSVVRGGGGISSIPVGAEPWLEKLYRNLKAFLITAIGDNSEFYDLVEGFPPISTFTVRLPLEKVIIHFDIDDVHNPELGFGENIVDSIYNLANQTLNPVEASWHTVNFDIGVWASQGSGGSTARLRAYQILCDLFVGSSARQAFREQTGIEILDFTGGKFTQEDINELPIWRVMNMTLVVRVFSQKVANVPIPYVSDSVFVEPHVTTIENVPITD